MTDIQFTSNSSKASIWQQHLIQWQSSGWTQKAYCRENNLSHRYPSGSTRSSIIQK
jgi:hypothetical protein